MRTFKSEARRLIRQYVPGDPPADRLAQTLVWVLYANGDLKKRHRCPHGKRAWKQRVFRGGVYRPRPPEST
jgi:hypothetical protein